MMARLVLAFLLVAVLAGSALGSIDALMQAITGGYGGGARVNIPVPRPVPVPNAYSWTTPVSEFSFGYGYRPF
ncbi:uncharacterized protein Dana_GF27217 [Drosophila ananassae]|uniref:Uncharacterized protein n=1 Tax=Drosophila ananassae TaxID=7217 RepID=A0A0P9BZB8_DROAN|nr:uncharacterized protein Dana_GF27217 [Drosophila ananassae]